MIRSLALRTTLAICAATAANALTLSLPERAQPTAEEDIGIVSADLPAGPWTEGQLPTVRVEGRETRQAFILRGGPVTSAQLMIPLREQVVAQGFDLRFECETRDCGGFDFRLSLDLIPAPDMFVDLGSFRYLLALRETDQGTQALAIVTSATQGAGHVHVTRIDPETQADPEPTVVIEAPAGEDPTSQPPNALTARLLDTGRAVLEGLTFGTGSSELSDETYVGLEELATFLIGTPGARVVVVGHTDATGSLEQNIELSQRRANAVRDQLVGEFGVNGAQIDARGIGYLAPRASNLSEEGRERNRRVEIVLLNPG